MFAYKEITKITKLQSWDSARLRTQVYIGKVSAGIMKQTDRCKMNAKNTRYLEHVEEVNSTKLSDLMTGSH